MFHNISKSFIFFFKWYLKFFYHSFLLISLCHIIRLLNKIFQSWNLIHFQPVNILLLSFLLPTTSFILEFFNLSKYRIGLLNYFTKAYLITYRFCSSFYPNYSKFNRDLIINFCLLYFSSKLLYLPLMRNYLNLILSL